MGSNCTDFCSSGDDCENQPNEAPETIGVANNSDRDDLDHDDLRIPAVPKKVMLISSF